MTSTNCPAFSRRTLAVAGGALIALTTVPAFAHDAHDSATPNASASPDASPAAATTPAPTTAEVLPAYQDLSGALRTMGRAVLEPLLRGDSSAIAAVMSPDLQAAITPADLAASIAQVQANLLRFSFTEVGAHWYGTFGQDEIRGFFQQGGAVDTFTLTPATESATPAASPIASASATASASPVAAAYPGGTWTGSLSTLGLPFAITLAGDASTPAATLTIASQGIHDVALTDVSFLPEAPLGDTTFERSIPLAPTSRIFSQARAWGDASILFDLTFADDRLTGFQFQPTAILPPDPAAGHVSTVTYRLPWHAGAWFVFWGGDTVEQNYHAVAPGQRHASDIVVWKDGSTFGGDGSLADMYWIWGQTLVAPAAGTVVEVLNDQPDQVPGPPLAATNPDAFKHLHPAGNHVVLQTAAQEFLYMAHMQHGSVRVQVGDVLKAGDPIGLVGNSGNTSEPHLHIHVQNVADFFDPQAIGLPLVFADLAVDGEPATDAGLLQGTFVEPTAS